MFVALKQDSLCVINDLDVGNPEQIISRKQLSRLLLVLSEVEVELPFKFRNHLLEFWHQHLTHHLWHIHHHHRLVSGSFDLGYVPLRVKEELSVVRSVEQNIMICQFSHKRGCDKSFGFLHSFLKYLGIEKFFAGGEAVSTKGFGCLNELNVDFSPPVVEILVSREKRRLVIDVVHIWLKFKLLCKLLIMRDKYRLVLMGHHTPSQWTLRSHSLC